MRRCRRSGYTAAVLTVAFGLCGCSPLLLFVGDPVFEASLADRAGFEREIEQTAGRAGYRAQVHWPAPQNLESLDVDEAIRSSTAQVVVLSPYLSLLAQDIVPRFPDRTFIGYYGAVDLPNMRWVTFDASSALLEAGRRVARWVFEAPNRTALLLVDESDPLLREEAAALATGYRDQAEIGLERIGFDRSPTRDEVRNRVQPLTRNGDHALVLLLGSATTWALEAIRDEEVRLGLRHGQIPPVRGRILFSVRDDLVAGLQAALHSSQGVVVAPGRLE